MAYAPTGLDFGSQNDPEDRYEIMSFAAEPRSRALGRVAGTVAGFASTHDMPSEGMWISDPHQNQFKDRQWHSGQFQFTNMIVGNFWDQMLRAYKLKSPQ